jgi:hypothetical protein
MAKVGGRRLPVRGHAIMTPEEWERLWRASREKHVPMAG